MRKIGPFLFVVLFCLHSAVGVFAQKNGEEQYPGKPIDLLTARQLLAEATLWNDSGKYVQAEASARQALVFFRTLPFSTECAEAAFQTGRALSKQDSLVIAQTFLQEAVDIQVALHPEGSMPEAYARVELGEVHLKLGNGTAALQEGLQALAIEQRILPENHCDRYGPSQLLGQIYRRTGQYSTAIPFYEAALTIARICEGEASSKTATTMVRLGICYANGGFIDRAISLLEKALAIEKRILDPEDPLIGTCCLELGNCQKVLHKYDDALIYYTTAFNIYQKIQGEKAVRLAYPASEIGQIYLSKKDFVKALEYFHAESDILIKYGADAGGTFAFACRDMGLAYFGMRDYKTALDWQEKALELFRGPEKSDELDIDQDISHLIFQIGRTQTALWDYKAAIASFEKSRHILQILFGSDCSMLYESDAEMAIAYQKWYLKTGIDSLLDKSRIMYQLAEKGIANRIQNETFEDARNTVLSETVPFFENAIGTELLFYKKQQQATSVEKAWQLSESMHSFLLFSASQEANARHFAGIPDEALKKDSLLRAEITALEAKKFALISHAGLHLTDSLVLAVSAEIFDKNDMSLKQRSIFEKQYPEYFRLKFDLQTASLAQTQQMLGPQQTLLEYFTGDSSIFVFALHHDDKRVVELPLDFPLAEWVLALREGISGYHSTQDLYRKTIVQYADYAQRLYDKLLLPLYPFLTPELIIIPGDKLADLPFEALLSGAPKDLSSFKTYPFLLRKYSICYAYSATMLQQMTARQHRKPPTGDLLAFAPFSEMPENSLALGTRDENNRPGLSVLPFSGQEISRVKMHFGSSARLLTGPSGTKQQFLDLAGQYRILHLATHGKANHKAGDFSYLAFSTTENDPENGLLSVGELYNCSLNADLVVLSACETGLGEEQRGEGVVSLARAFAFAGAKSIVSSLWKVNDKSTMQVMDNFYAELKSGTPKNEALTRAKRQYLEQYPGNEAHPFYWAGFVPVGDMSAIKN